MIIMMIEYIFLTVLMHCYLSNILNAERLLVREYFHIVASLLSVKSKI